MLSSTTSNPNGHSMKSTPSENYHQEFALPSRLKVIFVDFSINVGFAYT